MSQDLADQPRFLDAGNHSQRAAAMGTGLDVNGKYPLQMLRWDGYEKTVGRSAADLYADPRREP